MSKFSIGDRVELDFDAEVWNCDQPRSDRMKNTYGYFGPGIVAEIDHDSYSSAVMTVHFDNPKLIPQNNWSMDAFKLAIGDYELSIPEFVIT